MGVCATIFQTSAFLEENALRNFAAYYHLSHTLYSEYPLRNFMLWKRPLTSINQAINQEIIVYSFCTHSIWHIWIHWTVDITGTLALVCSIWIKFECSSTCFLWAVGLKVVPRQSHVYHTLSQKLSKIYFKNYFQDLFSHKQTCEKLEQYSAYCVSIPFLKLLIYHF